MNKYFTSYSDHLFDSKYSTQHPLFCCVELLLLHFLLARTSLPLVSLYCIHFSLDSTITQKNPIRSFNLFISYWITYALCVIYTSKSPSHPASILHLLINVVTIFKFSSDCTLISEFWSASNLGYSVFFPLIAVPAFRSPSKRGITVIYIRCSHRQAQTLESPSSFLSQM